MRKAGYEVFLPVLFYPEYPAWSVRGAKRRRKKHSAHGGTSFVPVCVPYFLDLAGASAFFNDRGRLSAVSGILGTWGCDDHHLCLHGKVAAGRQTAG